MRYIKPVRWFLSVSTLLATITASGTVLAQAAGPPPCDSNCAAAFTPAVGTAPFGITGGPRGSVWFSLNSAVGRIDQQGQITTYAVPAPHPIPGFTDAGTGWMTVDSAGFVWFAERGTGKIGRLAPDGSLTEFSLPKATAVPQGIVFGPDGNVYVSEQGANAVARLNPATGEATDIGVPTPNSGPQSGALGSDGAIWFIERSAAKVGRMSVAGAFTEFSLAPGAFPNRIVSGPDGALWFTELRANKVGRITTGGVLTEYPVPGGPVGITVGKDGQMYVALFFGRAVARINTSGALTGSWTLPGAKGPLLVATGFGHDIWVTDSASGKIYRVTPYAAGQ